MKKILFDKLPRLLKLKKQLEKELEVKITNKGRGVFVEGPPEKEYFAEKVLDAINLGFSFQDAIPIKTEGHVLEIFNLKDHTNRSDLWRVRGRLIGTDGRTKKTLCQLTDCKFAITEDNKLGIIGPPECILNAQNAAISIIRGSKQAKVYSYLEKHRVQPVLDLGLKKEKKK